MTKNEIQFVRSLGDKKVRDEAGLFVVEGRKLVEELAASDFVVREVFRVGDIFQSTAGGRTNECALPRVPERMTDDFLRKSQHVMISAKEMERISSLKTPTDVLAVVEKPRVEFCAEGLRDKLVLALDEVQNPGNVGTIVRLAEWFGIEDILCSEGCADVFNPKVVQATMGAITRVRVHYGSLGEMISVVGGSVYGAFLEGENIYRASLSSSGVVVLGSEGRGISAQIEQLVTKKLFIPPFTDHHPESLNVAIAGAIICSEFRKNV